ncbi:MAG: hypothetical protein LBI06_01925 [Treponema sp.]|jgi:hypothetical protein|nr:hypothetical protein [Treponema sp.]
MKNEKSKKKRILPRRTWRKIEGLGTWDRGSGILIVFIAFSIFSCYIYSDRRHKMPVAELIYEEVKTLPEDRATQVLEFVKHIKQEEASSIDDLLHETGEGCPICAKHRDPITGEPLYNAKTIAAIEEGDAMLRGEIPAKWHTSLDDLDEMLGL